MKTLVEGSAYLVESPTEIVSAIRKTVPQYALQYDTDELFVEDAVYGYDKLPQDFPFILVGQYNEDSVFPYVQVMGFSSKVFN